MIDELAALARLGDETAPPTAEARAGARLALEKAISEEQVGRDRQFRRPAPLRLAAAGAAAAAVVAAVLIAPLVRDGGGGGTALPVGLRTAILTAYDAESANILHVHQTLTASNGTSDASDQWARLGDAGRQVQSRMRFSDAAGAPIQDVQITYTLPPDAKRFTAVGDVVDVDYPSRTWFHETDGSIPAPPVLVPDAIVLGSLRNALAHGKWSDLGTTTLDGQAAIELVQHNPPAGKVFTVWVDPNTYRPIQEALTYTTGDHGHSVDGIVNSILEYLPPTPANLAQLNVTIPTGFTQTPSPR
jgi:hypothetical protein